MSHHADDGSFDPQTSLADPNALFGNYVVIDHGGTFGVYGHLQRDSVRVRTGDRVRRAQPLAAVGRSGSAEYPHLHFQLMDDPDMRAEGVPALFRDFDRLHGGDRVRVRRGAIDTGEYVFAR